MATKSKTAKPKSRAKDPERPQRPPTAEQADRNQEIVAAHLRGLSFEEIAGTYNLTSVRCKQIFAEWKAANPSLRHHDPLDIADDMLNGFQADIEQLAYQSMSHKSETAQVAAVKARAAVRARIIGLLQAMGVLPNDLGQLSIAIDAKFTATRVLAVLNEFKVPDEVRDALIAALEPGPQEQPALLDAPAREVAA